MYPTLKRMCLFSTALLLLACQASIPPEYGMVDWYLANGTGNDLTLNIFDKVCRQNHFRVRVSTTAATPISTCANSTGGAEIRYSRTGGISVTENPVRHDAVSDGESLFVQ